MTPGRSPMGGEPHGGGIRRRGSESLGNGRLFGILVTFRRPRALEVMLEALLAQSQPIQEILVVDNAASKGNRSITEANAARDLSTTYLPTGDNLGPAGAISIGMERVLEQAGDDDWVVLFDDDDPPQERGLLEELRAFALELLPRDGAIAGVGTAGARFDARRGRLVRTPDDQLIGAVPVDCIGGNQLPMYRVSAVREVGPFHSDLFFGFDDLEYGLRLRRAGWSLYAHGEIQRRSRERLGRLKRSPRPARRLRPLGWRDYYSVRNLIWICRAQGWTTTALRLSLAHVIGKPLVNVGRQPRLALKALSLNSRACRDAWLSRLGRRVEPDLLGDGLYGEKTSTGRGTPVGGST